MFDRLFIGYAQAQANFHGLPHEILALRKALGWSRQQLGHHLGVYVGKRDCETVRRWEKGICRPRPYLRVQMCGLVEGVGLGYREALLEVV